MSKIADERAHKPLELKRTQVRYDEALEEAELIDKLKAMKRNLWEQIVRDFPHLV